MKGYKSFIVAAVATTLAFTACENYDADNHKFDNAVYLDVSKTSEVQPMTFSNTAPTIDRLLQATLAYPAGSDVSVAISVDPSLVTTYNSRYGTSWPMLDPKYYSLSTEDVTIPAGKTVSEVVTLQLKELTGEGGEQTGALPIDETYLLPVRIDYASLPVLNGSSVAYYVVKRSSAITVAAQLTNNWINFPTLDKYSPGSQAFNGLTAMTYEALIYIDEFSTTASISSVMGVEQYLLLRIGDVSFERQQLQFDGSGPCAMFAKFPANDPMKSLESGRWYHVACTYDQNTRTVRIYVDGKIQSEATGVGVPLPVEKNRINLAMRALYDLWYNAANKAQYETDDKPYNTFGDAYQFFIGRSYDDTRPLNGKIAEARVWSAARTPEQIWENMYGIDNPQSDPTLVGYWKFNEGKGNVIEDYSQYGNDGVANSDIIWPDGIEVPKINEEDN